MATVAGPFKGGVGRLANRAIQKSQAQAAGETTGPYQQYTQAATAALPKMYAPLYGDISKQFQGQLAGARNMLGGNPALGNSGAPARLNRYLLSGAYGDLARGMSGAAAGAAGSGLDLLGSLIKQRIAAQQEERRQKQQGSGGIGGAIGGIAGGFINPALGMAGQRLGAKLF